MEAMAEALLLTTTLGESPGEFGELVERTQRRVFQIAYSVLANAADAEEIAQDAFLRAYRHHSSLRDPAAFGAWVGRTAFRLALNRRRGRARRLGRETAWHSTRASSSGKTGPEEMYDLRRQLERLPEKLRSVLLLSAVEGMTSAEVAAVLGIPAATVRSRLHLARKQLLKGMKP